MNELIIFGIICAVFVLLCAATAIVENFGEICDWLFDVVTAYYKFKLHRRRRKCLKKYI